MTESSERKASVAGWVLRIAATFVYLIILAIAGHSNLGLGVASWCGLVLMQEFVSFNLLVPRLNAYTRQYQPTGSANRKAFEDEWYQLKNKYNWEYYIPVVVLLLRGMKASDDEKAKPLLDSYRSWFFRAVFMLATVPASFVLFEAIYLIR